MARLLLTAEHQEALQGRYPRPIADRYRAVLEAEGEPRVVHNELLRLAESAVVYLTWVVWHEYHAAGAPAAGVESILRRRGGGPSFGTWTGLLRALTETRTPSVLSVPIGKRSDPDEFLAASEFCALWETVKRASSIPVPGEGLGNYLKLHGRGRKPSDGFFEFLGAVVECRNASAHHKYAATDELCAFLNPPLLSGIAELLLHPNICAGISTDYCWATAAAGSSYDGLNHDLVVTYKVGNIRKDTIRGTAPRGPGDYLINVRAKEVYLPFVFSPHDVPPAAMGGDEPQTPMDAGAVARGERNRTRYADRVERALANDGVISEAERANLDDIADVGDLTADECTRIEATVRARRGSPTADEGETPPIRTEPTDEARTAPPAVQLVPTPPSGNRRTWDETSYFADMAKRADSAAKLDLHRRVYEAACSIADGRTWVVGWGTGKNQGSFTLKCPDASILSAYSGGTLSLNLGAWGKLSAATSADLVRAFVEGLGFAPTDAICDGGTQFPNITAGLLRHDPDGARLPRWLRRAQSLIAGEAAAPATATAPTPTGPLPARCAAALRLIRDAGIVAFTPHEVSNDRSLFKVGLDAGGLWFQTEPQHSVFVWFHSAADGLLAAVGWYHSTESGDARWLAIRDRLEALGPELWPGWHFQRPDWKPGGGYEAYSRVGDGESADALAARLCRVVAALSAALVAAGAGTAAAAPEDPVERTAALLGNVPTELGGYLGKFAVQTSREDWSNLTESLGTPPRPFTRKTKSSDKWMDGRVGLDLVSPWRPGVFAGIFLDPTDHKVTPSQPYLGMDFVVILDTQHNQCRVPYDTLPAFGALVRRLTANPGRWNVLDHVGTARKPNRWHPIHLRRPLVEVWEGARNAEERYAAWLGAAREGIDLLLSGGEARDLRAAWAEAGPTRVAEPSAQADTDVDESDSFETLPTRGIQERAESVLLDEAEARGVKSLLVRLRAYVTERCVQVPGLNEVRKVWAFAYACKGATLGYSTGAVTVLHLNVRDHDEPRRLLVSLRDAELRRGNNAAAMNALMSRWAKGPVDGRGYRAITLGTESEVDAFWQDLAALQPFSGG